MANRSDTAKPPSTSAPGGDADIAFAVNGRAYHAALDPKATGARSDGIPDPVLRRRGRGVQAHYRVSPACAALIRQRLSDIAESWLSDGDPDELGERQACLKAVRQVDQALAASHRVPPSQTPIDRLSAVTSPDLQLPGNTMSDTRPVVDPDAAQWRQRVADAFAHARAVDADLDASRRTHDDAFAARAATVKAAVATGGYSMATVGRWASVSRQRIRTILNPAGGRQAPPTADREAQQ